MLKHTKALPAAAVKAEASVLGQASGVPARTLAFTVEADVNACKTRPDLPDRRDPNWRSRSGRNSRWPPKLFSSPPRAAEMLKRRMMLHRRPEGNNSLPGNGRPRVRHPNRRRSAISAKVQSVNSNSHEGGRSQAQTSPANPHGSAMVECHYPRHPSMIQADDGFSIAGEMRSSAPASRE